MALAPVEPSPPGAANFWRWLVTALLLSALVTYTAQSGIALVSGEVEVPLSSQSAQPGPSPPPTSGIKVLPEPMLNVYVTAHVSPKELASPALVYALIFLLNFFFLQRFEKLAAPRAWSLALLGSGALVVALAAAAVLSVLVAALLFFAELRLSYPFPAGGFVGPTAFHMLEQILPPVAGCALLAAVLAAVHRRYSPDVAARSPRLVKAHLWGGVAGGALLGLDLALSSGVLAGSAPAATPPISLGLSLALLLLAAVPHATFTYRAMRPALAGAANTLAPNGVFLARLAAIVIPSLLLAAIFAAAR